MDTIWTPDISNHDGPKYRAVADALRDGISDGTLLPGEKLPPVRDLAWRLQITPGTVARAYTILTDAGLLEAGVGRGTFVAHARIVEEAEIPLEIDAVAHGKETNGDSYRVNLFSPHLPAMGQARLIREAFAKIAADPPSGMMHYPSQVGSAAARTAIARWLAGASIGSFSADDIVLTHGGQNAISMVLQSVLRGRSPTILVEELCYPGFKRAADLLRANIVPVAMDKEGVIPAALEEAAKTHDAEIFCTSPEVHNPTGLFTPRHRREELAKVARRTDMQILEDDCYHMSGQDAPTYRMIAPDRGWYVSSISKQLTPALRVGYALAPQGKTSVLRRTAEHSFFGLATPICDAIAMVLGDPRIDQVAEDVIAALATYIKSAVNILGGYDLTWRRDVPFLWLALPPGWRAVSFCQAAEAQGVQVRAGEEFACRDAAAPHAVRMAINAGVNLSSFEAAMQRLRVLLDNPPERISV